MISMGSITTKEDARQYAIEWQQNFENAEYDTADLVGWTDFFTRLGEQFGLTEEFEENGII